MQLWKETCAVNMEPVAKWVQSLGDRAKGVFLQLSDQIPTYLTTTLPGAAPHCQRGALAPGF